MSSIAHLAIHPSQFPDAVRRDLLASLRAGRVNHKFHYDSFKQTRKWLAIHRIFSPSRNDADCAAAYDRSFAAAAARIQARRVRLIGLGCGGGQKDARLLKLLKNSGREVSYTPCDVSTAMVLVARQTALEVVPAKNCFPFVCDLASAADLSRVFKTQQPPKTARLITFFGMIPNFEPGPILSKLAGLVRRGDFLLFSANLAPGGNYAEGMKKILPQYDNPATRDWLMTFLLDLGVEQSDGELRFHLEDRCGLKRVAADFRFARTRRLEVDRRRFTFGREQTIRLFFSYRYTQTLVRAALRRHGLHVLEEWIAVSKEEGVFLCRRR